MFAVRGPTNGRIGLCWDSQLFHGAVPGRTAGLVSVYWQPQCVLFVYLCINVLVWVIFHSSMTTQVLLRLFHLSSYFFFLFQCSLVWH